MWTPGVGTASFLADGLLYRNFWTVSVQVSPQLTDGLLTTKSILQPHVVIEKVAHIKSGLALIAALGTKLEQLEEIGSRVAQAFGACQTERN